MKVSKRLFSPVFYLEAMAQKYPDVKFSVRINKRKQTGKYNFLFDKAALDKIRRSFAARLKYSSVAAGLTRSHDKIERRLVARGWRVLELSTLVGEDGGVSIYTIAEPVSSDAKPVTLMGKNGGTIIRDFHSKLRIREKNRQFYSKAVIKAMRKRGKKIKGLTSGLGNRKKSAMQTYAAAFEQENLLVIASLCNEKKSFKNVNILESIAGRYHLLYAQIVRDYTGFDKNIQLSRLSEAYADAVRNGLFEALVVVIKDFKKEENTDLQPLINEANLKSLQLLNKDYKIDYARLCSVFMSMAEKAAEYMLKFGSGFLTDEKAFFSEYISPPMQLACEDMSYIDFKNLILLCLKKHRDEEEKSKIAIPYISLQSMSSEPKTSPTGDVLGVETSLSHLSNPSFGSARIPVTFTSSSGGSVPMQLVEALGGVGSEPFTEVPSDSILINSGTVKKLAVVLLFALSISPFATRVVLAPESYMAASVSSALGFSDLSVHYYNEKVTNVGSGQMQTTPLPLTVMAESPELDSAEFIGSLKNFPESNDLPKNSPEHASLPENSAEHADLPKYSTTPDDLPKISAESVGLSNLEYPNSSSEPDSRLNDSPITSSLRQANPPTLTIPQTPLVAMNKPTAVAPRPVTAPSTPHNRNNGITQIQNTSRESTNLATFKPQQKRKKNPATGE